MKKKINIHFLLIITLYLASPDNGIAFDSLYFKRIIQAGSDGTVSNKSNTQLLVRNGCVGADCGKEGCRGFRRWCEAAPSDTGRAVPEKLFWIPMQKSAVWTITVQDRRFHRHCRPEKGRQSASPAQSVKMRFIMPYGWRTEVSCARQRKQAVSQVFSRAILPVIVILCVLLFALCMILSHFLTGSIIEPIENLADNLDASDSVKVYKELVPFVQTIKKQHG